MQKENLLLEMFMLLRIKQSRFTLFYKVCWIILLFAVFHKNVLRLISIGKLCWRNYCRHLSIVKIFISIVVYFLHFTFRLNPDTFHNMEKFELLHLHRVVFYSLP